MEKQFIKYDQALELKKLGFNEPCLAYYEPNKEIKYIDFNDFKSLPFLACNSEWQDLVGSPLKQHFFDWVIEKYQFFPEIVTDCTSYPKFCFRINEFTGNPSDLTSEEWGWVINDYSVLYRAKEEAEINCIDELISKIKEINVTKN